MGSFVPIHYEHISICCPHFLFVQFYFCGKVSDISLCRRLCAHARLWLQQVKLYTSVTLHTVLHVLCIEVPHHAVLITQCLCVHRISLSMSVMLLLGQRHATQNFM